MTQYCLMGLALGLLWFWVNLGKLFAFFEPYFLCVYMCYAMVKTRCDKCSVNRDCLKQVQ